MTRSKRYHQNSSWHPRPDEQADRGIKTDACRTSSRDDDSIVVPTFRLLAEVERIIEPFEPSNTQPIMSENQAVPTDAQAAGVPTPANPAQTAEVASAGTETEGASGPTKGELKRRAKEAEKAKKAAERAAKEEEEKKKREAAASVDNASQNYGKLPLHQSQERNGALDNG